MRSKELAKGVDSVIFALSGKFKISLSDAKLSEESIQMNHATLFTNVCARQILVFAHYLRPKSMS